MTYTSRTVYEFISKQTNDPIVEWKTCKVSGQLFPIYQSDVKFYEKISPVFNGKKYQIPTPTLCPEERQRRRLVFRNERNLYRHTCASSGKSLISIYSPDKSRKIYDQKVRWSDGWNAMEYGREYDFSRSFVENFQPLHLMVPRANLHNFDNENCEYVNEVINCKSCYLLISAVCNEYSLYSQQTFESNYLVDCLMAYNSEWCYQCYNVHDSYQCLYCTSVEHCRFCYNCINCTNLEYCINCHNLDNKRYCIDNIQYTSEEYATLSKHLLLLWEQKKLNNVFYKTMDTLQTENSYGMYLTATKHLLFSENIQNSEDCKYCERGAGMADCMDCVITGVVPNSLLYEAMTVGPWMQTLFCMNCRPNVNFSFYCDNCSNCSHCFACVWLQHKEYCIFNKQYTKEEYEIQVAKIIEKMQETGERGEFFHPSLSPFWYNETVANEYLPLEKSDLPISYGYKRSDYSSDPKIPEGAELLYPEKMADEEWKVLVTDDSIVNKVIICKESWRPFAIQKLELAFYRKLGLQLPKQHPDVRHEARMKQRPGRTLHLRTCDKCEKEVLSIYPAEDTRTVYCEECYRQEVYG